VAGVDILISQTPSLLSGQHQPINIFIYIITSALVLLSGVHCMFKPEKIPVPDTDVEDFLFLIQN